VPPRPDAFVRPPARVLIIAGSDSGGGAGIQADIKTVTALGGYAASAVTALTAQNTQGVFGIHDVPVTFIVRQVEVVLGDIGADCVKIGMLHRPEIVEAIFGVLSAAGAGIPVVLDPVMAAKSGHPLLVPEAVESLRQRLVPLATVLTPNLPEAHALACLPSEPPVPATELAVRLLALGPEAILVKGGHDEGPVITDVLAVRGNVPEVFQGARIATRHTHGTGCTLASAIATGLAQGLAIPDAVVRARAYVLEAIRTAPGLGHGHGPLQHGHTVRPFPAES
jgi:hydroxymethylpyrimidine/phosphomethylpyrimidine kinase